jgi:hypothetical protein
MSGPLQELERLSAEAHSKKGRMDADSRKQAAAILYLIWTDPAQDLTATLPYLPDLKAEALADAIAQSWPKMDGERRSLFAQWVPDPTTERDVRRLAFLTGSLIEIDPTAAVRWLLRLMPPERRTPTKETRQHLASGLLDTSLEFHGVARATSEPRETVRLYALLWSIATDPAFTIPTMSRVRLARAIVAFGKNNPGAGLNSALESLRSQIVTESASWPSAIRSEFDRPTESSQHQHSAPTNRAPLPSAGTVEAEADAGVHLQPVTASTPALSALPLNSSVESRAVSQNVAPAPAGSTETRLASDSVDLRLEQRIARVPEDLSLLRSIQTLLRRHEEERTAYTLKEQELVEARREAGELRSSLNAATHDRDLNRDELRQERARADDLAKQLRQLAEDAEEERRRLAQQISVNASGRVDEYKNRLGSSLSRLVKDLPARHTDVSQELGQVLLLQFHQFLDALRQEGIAVHDGRGFQ